MHPNKAFAAELILYGVLPERLLIPIMKIKDPFARFESVFPLCLSLRAKYGLMTAL